MLIRIAKKELNLAVSRLQATFTDKELAKVVINAEQAKLTFYAADRSLMVYSEHSVSAQKEGLVAVPGRLFCSVARELPEGEVTLSTDDNFVTVDTGHKGGFFMRLPRLELEGWQPIPRNSSQNKAEISCKKLLYLIDQVQFCVAHESPRNYGSVGFLHRSKEQGLRIVGTDGFRLSYAEFEGAELPQEFLPNGICLSKRVLNEIHRMCAEGAEQMTLSISDDESFAMAEICGYTIIASLSSVQYPGYEGVLPSGLQHEVALSRPYLQGVTKRVLLASDKSNAVQLCFKTEQLTLMAQDIGSSEGTETIDLEDYSGSDCELAVNGKYLCDIFGTISGERLKLKFCDPQNPIVVLPEREPSHCHSMHVLVPIRESHS